MDSETDSSSYSDYNEFANEIPFVGDMLQPCQFEPVFTAAETQAGTSALSLTASCVTELDTQPAH